MLSKRVFVLAVVCAAAAHADVTLRYQTKFQLNPTLPPQMAEQATKGMGTAMPPEMVMQWKEGKGFCTFGKLKAITDLVKKQITILDPDQKTYSTTTQDELASAMSKAFSNLPPEAKAAMAAMKITTNSKMTGRTETIQGIPAEEREVMMSIEAPAGVPNAPQGPMMEMTFQFWTAKEDDLFNNPVLRELKGYNLWAYQTMNPAAAMEQMFQAMPGMGEGIGKFMKDLSQAKAMVLRSHVTLRMPFMAAMIKQMPPEQNPFGKNFDPNTPFMEMSQELTEVSSASVPASVFAIPADYKPVAAEEITKGMMDRAKQAAQQGAKQ